MRSISRRTFLGSAAVGGALGAGALASETRLAPNLQPVPYGAVTLLESPLKRQFDQNHTFFSNLSEDRMLKIYRRRTGLAAPGENMGGWYEDFCPGAHFGQYVSALARFAGATGSADTRAKVQRLVAGYAQTLNGKTNFFVDLRYPGYTYDKIVCALLDAHSLADDSSAFSVLEATTQAAVPHMVDRALTDEERQTLPAKDDTYRADESYTLAENLFLAYERTGEMRYFDMARRYLLDRSFFDPLAMGQDILPGLHAYSHMNALSSGMQGYLKLGDPKYLQAVTFAVDQIWKHQSFATGGWGPNETFVEPGKGQLGASLADTHRSFETPCGAYAHIKLMRYLLALTADPQYGDSMEQVLYNTVLGAKPVREDGWSFYYSDYHHSGYKTDHRVIPDAWAPWDRDGRWPCCSGTLPQAAADYVINIYFRDRAGLYLNLYTPSQLTWSANGSRYRLTQQTRYPDEGLVTFRMEASSPAEFPVYFRIPGWAGVQTSLTINGKRLTAAVKPGTFLPVNRTWQTGDLVELDIAQPVRTRSVDEQSSDQVAILRGPQVLFAIAEKQPELTRHDLGRLQINRTTEGYLALVAGETPHTLRTFPEIGDEVYQTYWKLRS